MFIRVCSGSRTVPWRRSPGARVCIGNGTGLDIDHGGGFGGDAELLEGEEHDDGAAEDEGAALDEVGPGAGLEPAGDHVEHGDEADDQRTGRERA